MRTYWKASIDLSRPQVGSMGQHDPLDGLITCVQLDATARALRPTPPGPSLAGAAADFAAMLGRQDLATADPLGLGGLLVDAYRVAQLMRHDAWPREDCLFDALLGAALGGLPHCLAQPDLRASADHRLAFRELGLAIGLAAIRRMEEDGTQLVATPAARARLEQLARYVPLGTDIEAFWLLPGHQRTPAWIDHQDINEVMLATRLVPDGFLVLRPVP
jgi:hypothetical protein